MKTSQLLPLFALLMVFSLFTGCKKDDETPEPSTKEKLVAHNWRGDKVMAMGMDASTHPILASQIPDIKTMVLVFNENNTYTATYSDNGQTIPLSGTWELRNQDKFIHFDLLASFGLPEQVEIKTLTSSNLVLTTTAQVPVLGPTPLEVHFIAQ
ncbi:lipocalin family protein [Pontibacter sp. 13R65]|uniref:lipocalin family protein n=1 Tax=Pontibacter sp. 13R65 TaxID=3127458 RepID=UPI00301C41A7